MLAGFAAAGAGLAFLWVSEGLIGPSSRPPATPPDDLPIERVSLPTATGADVDGWYLAGRPGAGSVVLLHGVRASRLGMLGRARFLHAAGYSVLLIDLPAHGASPGARITFGAREALAARSTLASARRRSADGPVAAIGVSMGGAALLLADPPLDLAAVVLESVYPTIDEAVENRLAIRLGTLGRWISPALVSYVAWRLGIEASALRPIDRIASIGTPVFVISGSEDRRTELAETERLFAAASQPKRLWVVEGAAHVDLHRFAGRDYEDRVLDFLSPALAPAAADPGQRSIGNASSSR